MLSQTDEQPSDGSAFRESHPCDGSTPLSPDEIAALRAAARVVLASSTEQHAHQVIRAIAKHLEEAADALDVAAYHLREAHLKGPYASLTKQAATRARDAVKGLA